ncbi:MAG: putative peptidase [Prokaryotic dsDNA virus sp.]|nr:MAG: putative peptidase [Prokaryotic dsDNA virus sp.]|tara:strand:- start:5023 stop:6297 length:1275 start_codon:yes stop_codon:yes gene_type:complete
MPCKKCENGKYKFGDNGNCMYNTLAECRSANTYDIVELVIDKDNEALAIDAISLVTDPAIEQDFIFFNTEKNNLNFAAVDKDQRLLVSPALIPYKQIYRYDAKTDKEYYVHFSADTVRQASEAYMVHQNTNSATIQHENKVTGVHTIESWIVEDSKKDKSNLYGFELPVGTWFVSMRVNNDDVWQRIKSGELKGLSIEGYFVDRMEQLARVGSMVTDGKDGKIDLPLYDNKEEALQKAKELGCDGVHEHTLDGKTTYMPCADHDIISNLAEILQEDCEECNKTDLIDPNPCQAGYEPYGHKIKDGRKVPNCVPIEAKKKEFNAFQNSYTDYPQSASRNAKRAIKFKEKTGSKCGTRVGWTRARQLANRSPISRDTIARMASFERHRQHKDVPYTEGCGGLMWDAWGGSSGIRWAQTKLKEIDGE